METGAVARATASAPLVDTGYRPDIQGLRALAVLLVLGYHANLPFLPGGYVGVDVFFVVSGYLITGLLVREAQGSGTVDLVEFYARRARRLLPASAVALLAVAVATPLLLPVTRWATIAGDLVAGSLYLTNWRFAAGAVEYGAPDAASSPVLHYWSLAVEEQYYLLWPLLILAVVWLARRRGWGLRSGVLLGLGVLLVPSLVWSITHSLSEPARAYFVTTTRLWELALGGTLALLVPMIASRLRAAARWWVLGLHAVGLAAILVAAVRFGGDTPFPGVAAALPTLGTAAMIAAGAARRETVVDRVLCARPAVAIGGLSYSLYLWHWPVLVLAAGAAGTTAVELSPPVAVGVVAASAVPAWLGARLVEQPLHRSSWLRAHRGASLAVPLAITGLACTAGLALAAAVPDAEQDPSATPAAGEEAGARALPEPLPPVVDEVDGLTPTPLQAREDDATLDGESCIRTIKGPESVVCEAGPDDPAARVAVVGDSKMHQWLPAIEAAAEPRRLEVVTRLASAFPLASVPIELDGRVWEQCGQENRDRLDALTSDPDLDAVLISQREKTAHPSADPDRDPGEVLVDDMVEVSRRLLDAGLEVIVVLDNPTPGREMIDCAAANRGQLSACVFDRDEAVGHSAAPEQLAAAERVPGVTVLDVTDRLCNETRCPAAIEGMLTYRQGSHVTATYARALTPLFGDVLDRALDDAE